MDLHPTEALRCTAGTALAAVAHRLRCPHCAAPLRHTDRRALTCPGGHSFDIARQGYVSLLPGRRRHRGDGPGMVVARGRFLGRDHFRPVRSTITALVAQHAPEHAELVLDLAGGIGHYLAPVLDDALPGAHGAVVDLSTAGLRRAARAHLRAAALAADLRHEVPLVSGSADVVLSVFAPRPPAEITRVLAGDGLLVLATARSGHLRELGSAVGALGVDPRKRERVDEAFAGFEVLDEQDVDWRLALDRRDVADLIAMGPSAHHLDHAELREAVAALPTLLGVTAAMSVRALRPRR